MSQTIIKSIRGALLRPRAGSLSSRASAHLDMFRGIAAFLVLIGHGRALLFLDGSQLRHRNACILAFYWFTKLGHQAVIVFFVLSGFLVGRTVLRPMWSGTWSTKRYLIHRLTRLEVVLIPALILCWMWDSTGIHLFHSSAVYSGMAGLWVLPIDVAQNLKPHIFFGNIAFLQTVYVPTFGSNDPLWSLTNEFWYYVMFPCIVIAFSGGCSLLKRAIALMLLVGLICIFTIHQGHGILSGFLLWLLGAALAVLPPPRWLTPRFLPVFFFAAIVLVTLQMMLTYAPAPFNIEGFAESDYILGILFTGLMYFSLYDTQAASVRYQKTAKYAAGASYTLYVTHMPVLVFIAAWLGHRWFPDLRHLFLAAAILCVPLAYAIAVSMVFERNTDKLRKRIETVAGI